MSEFHNLLDRVQKLKSLISKDNQQSRESLERTSNKLAELNNIKTEFRELKIKFNAKAASLDKVQFETVKATVEQINKTISEYENILQERLKNINSKLESVKEEVAKTEAFNLSDTSELVNMGEKFDLRTAASLLPQLDGQESTTKRLIDAIELYRDLLDEDGKIFLITYILKTRLSENAKLRLEKTYNNVNNLIKDMRIHLLATKSEAVLSSELHSAKQKGKTIDEFGKNIETLLSELTISQAKGDDNATTILKRANEKIAINTFVNGLQNSELRTIIKARNYTSLKETITGALEENQNLSPTREPPQSNIFHIRGHNSVTRGYYRGNRRPFRGQRYTSPNNNNNYKNTYYPNTNNKYNSNYTRSVPHRQNTNSQRNVRRQGRAFYNSNSRFTHSQNSESRNHQRAYVADSTSNHENSENMQSTQSNSDWFFRGN